MLLASFAGYQIPVTYSTTRAEYRSELTMFSIILQDGSIDSSCVKFDKSSSAVHDHTVHAAGTVNSFNSASHYPAI